MFALVVFLCGVAVVRSASAPFIQPCHAEDSACLLASAKAAIPFMTAGIPELGVAPLDPLILDVVTSNEGGLQLTFRNTSVTGMSGCVVEALKLEKQRTRQILTVRCSVDLRGRYKLGGQLLILPIRGEGKHRIKIRDIVIKSITDLSTVTGEDGKPHWSIKKWKHTFDVKTNTHFEFENLFNGNKALADPVIAFANTNWREVMREVAPPIVKAIVAKVIDGLQALYKAVPIDQLQLD